MIPQHPNWSPLTIATDFITEIGAPLPPSNVAEVTRGGVDIQDSTQGVNSYWWCVAYVNGRLVVYKFAGGWVEKLDVTAEFPAGTVRSCSMAFDQNANINVAADVNGTSYLYYFNSQTAQMETISLGNAKTPKLYFDYPNDRSNANSDVMVFYAVTDVTPVEVRFKMQRDRYLVEYTTPNIGDVWGDGIYKIGLDIRNRFQVVPA